MMFPLVRERSSVQSTPWAPLNPRHSCHFRQCTSHPMCRSMQNLARTCVPNAVQAGENQGNTFPVGSMENEMGEMQLTSHHRQSYGNWAGRPSGSKADPTRCAQTVCANERGAIPKQCGRKRGYGPESAFCRQHDPAAVAARDAGARDRHEAEWKEHLKKIYGPTFLNALREIAAGHNDPRALAQSIIDKFDSKN